MFEPPPGKFDFPATEQRILEFWDREGIFERSIRLREGAERFVFYEGPPTANGMPHPGHCLTRVMKDIFPRYKTMCGYQVERKGGWDTHGLPVEREVEKELGLQGKGDIEKYGVEKFILKCINSVWRYTREWEDMTRRLAYWVDLPNAYATYHQSYVESVWWSLKQLFERGLLYQAHKIVWWWPQGGTALSSGEVGEGYRTVDDPSVFVKFPLVAGQRIGGERKGGGQDARRPPVTETSSIQEPPPAEGGAGILPAQAGMNADLRIRRRRLPHWEAGGSTFFVTFRTSGAVKRDDGRMHSSELSEPERTIALDACLHFEGDRFNLHSAVIMPDHVHLLLTPLEKEKGRWWSLAELLHSIKSYSAKLIAAQRRAANPSWTGTVWQEEYFDRIIRSDADFEEKRAYIQRNPMDRGLGDEYRWLWDEIAKHEDGGQDARPTLAEQPLSTGQEFPERTSLLVWTTTPWTLISNQFAAVHPEITYALVHDAEMDESLIVAAELVERLSAKLKRDLKILGNFRGSELIGRTYLPPFPDVYHEQAAAGFHGLQKRDGIYDNPEANLGQLKAFLDAGGADTVGWRVTAADFVTTESGTGLVHEAPAFGEVDYDLLQKERARFLDPEAIPLLCAVNPDGTFNNDAPERYRGRLVFECDKEIIHELRHERKTPWGTPLLSHHEQVRHEYPFCPRAENDKLMQYARKSWFVRTSAFKDEFLKNSAAMSWLPEHIKEGRVGDFLRNNVDWALSRERYWGTPLPIWQCERCGAMEAVPSFEALKAKPGASEITDEHPEGFWAAKVAEHATQGEDLPEHLKVHKPYIDAWRYACARCCDPGKSSASPEGAGSAGVSPASSASSKPRVTVDLSKRRRRLIPHWEAGGSTYFITFRVREGTLTPDERSLVLEACRHWDESRLLLHAVVVMPDHVHLLCTPLEKQPGSWWSIAELLHSIKGFTAQKLNEQRQTSGAIWQSEYFDRTIRSQGDFDEKWNYIVENPARKGLGDAYPWTWVEPSHAEPSGGPEARTPRLSGKQGIEDLATGPRMRRVPEVIDCWWDAGSMPFAQWGYPHAPGSAERLKARFPADFISEAIDQTRGWFYALLAINTLLFADGVREKEGGATPREGADVAGQYPLPFRTCIVLGHIAGEDGLKMSKRLRNYREPTYIFDTYGADAMRWYFLSAQAPWTSVRFQEAAIRDSQREFLVKLYNVLRLFTIYANIDGFDPRPRPEGLPIGWRATAQRGELDRWIVTELHRTVAEVRSAMDRFENYPAAQRLNDFVEALSNWYVRRSRERFWRPVRGADEPGGAAANQDKWDAYHTLYGCLLTVARLIAPFTPFFAEMMYQTLTGNAEMRSRQDGSAPADPFAAATAMDLPISVHLADYPRPEEIRYSDPALLEEMDIVREIASLGRAARAAASVKEARKVRQPLARVEVVLARPEYVEWLESHKPLIAEELNVKQVEFIREADQYVIYKVVPNFPAIGKKYRALVPGIKAALVKVSDPAAARKTLADTGKLPMRVDGQDIELSGEEVEIRLEAKPGWSAAQGRFGVVVLSTEVTPELRDEGLVRELIHHVQALRKELELPYEARVRLRIAAEGELEAVLRRFEDEVKHECLVTQVEYGPSRVEDLREVKVESYSARLAIDRV